MLFRVMNHHQRSIRAKTKYRNEPNLTKYISILIFVVKEITLFLKLG